MGKREAKPLIQKYDHLCGTLPDRRPADISPLKRHPCWHLKRDLSICTDGTVPLCKEDVSRLVVLGNAFTMPLETIWENGRRLYSDQIQSCYKGYVNIVTNTIPTTLTNGKFLIPLSAVCSIGEKIRQKTFAF